MNDFSDDFLNDYQDKISWFVISHSNKFDKRKIRRFQDQIKWNILCENKSFPMDVDFIREFQDKVDWRFLKRNINLTDEVENEFNEFFNNNY